MTDRKTKIAERAGVFHVVATPIGNLADISQRAIDTLNAVDLILAEDTRHSRRLLNHYGISTRLKACHEHNEAESLQAVDQALNAGDDIALISDAGTPLISDPGFVMVRELRALGHRVVAIPGASAIIAALSVAGLPTDRFIYEGFLPAKQQARCKQLERFVNEVRTVVFLESSHRVLACIQDMVEVFGGQRRVAVARELTKKFETVLLAPLTEILAIMQADPDQTRGEFVLLLEGAAPIDDNHAETALLLRTLMRELPLKQAVALTAELSGQRKNDIYQQALALRDDSE